MIKSDKDMLWRPKRIYIPANHFTGITSKALTAGACSEAWDIGEGFAGVGVGAPEQQEVAASGLVGIDMENDADEVNTLMQVPYDMDTSKPIHVRVFWSTESATTTDSVQWVVRYMKMIVGTTVIASAATALDKTIADDLVDVATADILYATDYGSIFPGATDIDEKVEFIHWEVEMDTRTAITELIHFLGLEITYTPHKLQRGVMPHEAKRPTYLASEVYAN